MRYAKGLTAKKVIDITRSYEKKIEAPKNEQREKLSPKARKIADIIESRNFGCYETKVAELMSVLLDEPISKAIITSLSSTGNVDGDVVGRAMPAYLAIVMLTIPNAHNYPLKTVCLHETSDYFIQKNGKLGNHAPLAYRTAWRLATNDEIKKAFK